MGKGGEARERAHEPHLEPVVRHELLADARDASRFALKHLDEMLAVLPVAAEGAAVRPTLRSPLKHLGSVVDERDRICVARRGGCNEGTMCDSTGRWGAPILAGSAHDARRCSSFHGKRWSDMTTKIGSSTSNMERAAMMLDACPRFHEALHHTNSTRIASKSSARTTAASSCALCPSVIATCSMPTRCSPRSRWISTGLPSTRISWRGMKAPLVSSAVERRAAAGTSALRTLTSRSADIPAHALWTLAGRPTRKGGPHCSCYQAQRERCRGD